MMAPEPLPVRTPGDAEARVSCEALAVPGGVVLRLDEEGRVGHWCEVPLSIERLRRLVELAESE